MQPFYVEKEYDIYVAKVRTAKFYALHAGGLHLRLIVLAFSRLQRGYL